jgi:hypothetical protein
MYVINQKGPEYIDLTMFTPELVNSEHAGISLVAWQSGMLEIPGSIGIIDNYVVCNKYMNLINNLQYRGNCIEPEQKIHDILHLKLLDVPEDQQHTARITGSQSSISACRWMSDRNFRL